MLQLASTHPETGERIRELRRDRGWTQEDLAAEIRRHPRLDYRYEISVRTIHRAEQGHKPRVRGQFAIATVLDTTPRDLWPPDDPWPRLFPMAAAA